MEKTMKTTRTGKLVFTVALVCPVAFIGTISCAADKKIIEYIRPGNSYFITIFFATIYNEAIIV
jgi:hypothetical protein